MKHRVRYPKFRNTVSMFHAQAFEKLYKLKTGKV